MTKFPLTAYLLQHIPTGECLPQRMFRTSNKGASTWRPWDPQAEPPYDSFPRTFRTKAQAEKCLAQFLRGFPEQVEIVPPDYWNGPDYKTVYTVSPEHVKTNFRILEATIYV